MGNLSSSDIWHDIIWMKKNPLSNHAVRPLSPQTFNTSNISTQCPDAECLFAFYGGETLYHKYLILFQFYNVFLFFWCANFVTALGQVTLSGAFASYYWAFKKPEDIPALPIFASLGRALRLEAAFFLFVHVFGLSTFVFMHRKCWTPTSCQIFLHWTVKTHLFIDWIFRNPLFWIVFIFQGMLTFNFKPTPSIYPTLEN